MFRWRTARRSAVTLARKHAIQAVAWRRWCANGALTVAALLAIGIPSLANAAENVRATTAARPTSLKLGVHYDDSAAVERLRDHARKSLAMASHFEEFECRLSSDVLNCVRGARIVLEGPFQDELLNIPVSGDARLEGSFRMATVPDHERACIEIHITGTVDMRGAGQTQGVRIESNATSRFQAIKRLYVDHEGARTLPTTCTAESSLVFTGIHSRPRLLGKFAERIAHQRAREDKKQAEAECTQHVIGAIAAVLDREGDRMARAIDQAIQEHLVAANHSQRATWHQTRFRTETDSISIARVGSGSTSLAPWQPVEGKRTPSILLRLPRTAFRPDHLLLALGLASEPASKPQPATASSDKTTPTLRPSVSWQDKTVTLAVDLESVARVAREPTIGAAQ